MNARANSWWIGLQWLGLIALVPLLPVIVLCVVAVKFVVKVCILCWFMTAVFTKPTRVKQPDDISNQGDS